MGSALQSYSLTTHRKTRQPFEHYTGVPTASGFNLDPTRTITLNYIDPSNVLAGSDGENALNALLAARRSFVEAVSLTEVPVSVSLNKAPRSPLNWSTTYLYPQGNLSDYLTSSFAATNEVFAQDLAGIRSWSLTANVGYAHYGKIEAGDVVIKGFQFDDATIRISANTDFEIPDFELAENVPTEGLILDINQHTLVAEVEQTEDTNLVTLYNYSWTFGVL